MDVDSALCALEIACGLSIGVFLLGRRLCLLLGQQAFDQLGLVVFNELDATTMGASPSSGL